MSDTKQIPDMRSPCAATSARSAGGPLDDAITTKALRHRITRLTRLCDTREAQGRDYVTHAVKLDLLTDVVLPIAEERDRLAAELERVTRDRAVLRDLRDIVAEQHEDCEQYAAWLSHPGRVGRCHVCELLSESPEALADNQTK